MYIYFRQSGTGSLALEKFPENMENLPDNMNIFFNEKWLSNTPHHFILTVKISFNREKFPKILKTFRIIKFYSVMQKTAFKHILIFQIVWTNFL